MPLQPWDTRLLNGPGAGLHCYCAAVSEVSYWLKISRMKHCGAMLHRHLERKSGGAVASELGFSLDNEEGTNGSGT